MRGWSGTWGFERTAQGACGDENISTTVVVSEHYPLNRTILNTNTSLYSIESHVSLNIFLIRQSKTTTPNASVSEEFQHTGEYFI